MNTTSSELVKGIIESLEPLENLSRPFYKDANFLGAIVASLTALGIALFSEPFKKLWRKTELVVNKDVLMNKQGNGGLILYRLSISNEGNYIAQDVEVYVDKVSGKNNFLPVPLTWTHARAYMTPGVYRNIHPKQKVLLDFCEFTKERNLLKFRLAAGDEVPDFCILDGNNKEINLKIYQASGKTISVKLKLDWKEGKDPSFPVIG